MKRITQLTTALICVYGMTATVGCGHSNFMKRPTYKRKQRKQRKRIPRAPAPPTFVVKCSEKMDGCDKVKELLSQEQRLAQRDFEFKAAMERLFAALEVDEIPPLFSVDAEFYPESRRWSSSDQPIQARGSLQVQYVNLRQRLGNVNYLRLATALQALELLDNKWQSLTRYNTQSLSLPMSTKNGEILSNRQSDIQVPKLVLSELKVPEAQVNVSAVVGLVNRNHGLSNHIVGERTVKLQRYYHFTAGMRALKVAAQSQLQTLPITFDMRVTDVCEDLRMEVRVERDLPVLKFRVAKNRTTDDDEPIMNNVIRTISAVNGRQPAVLRGGEWVLPPLAQSRKSARLRTLFAPLASKNPKDPQICIRSGGTTLHQFRSERLSLASTLKRLGLPIDVLFPDEIIRYRYTYLGAERPGFAEPSDLGDDLFKSLAKRKRAVLRLNTRINEIPYKLRLNTDTGKEIVLPVEVDGLPSRREIPAKARWRLVGTGDKFPILNQPTHHIFLQEVAQSGMVQLTDIEYELTHPEMETTWPSLITHEIGFTGSRGEWLGQSTVTASAVVGVSRDMPCDVAIDVSIEKTATTLFRGRNDSEIRKATYHPPNQPYAYGYVDPPHCKNGNAPSRAFGTRSTTRRPAKKNGRCSHCRPPANSHERVMAKTAKTLAGRKVVLLYTDGRRATGIISQVWDDGFQFTLSDSRRTVPITWNALDAISQPGKRMNGRSCYKDDQCESANCDSGQCRRQATGGGSQEKKPNGAACLKDSQCASGSC